jgi:hypothetical protein
MTHGPEHHIEEAEHASHAARDPFDRNVTMTIAIIAALLACVTMLGHRAHNETLRLQGEALQLQTEAGIAHSNAANKWALFQAQNIREHQYKAFLVFLDVLPTKSDTEKARNEAETYWKGQVKKYREERPKWMGEAEDLTRKGNESQQGAQEKLKESHEVHLRGDRFDLSELGVELGLVLCSLAVLTKRRGFWYTGMLSAGLGVLVAASALLGLFFPHH